MIPSRGHKVLRANSKLEGSPGPSLLKEEGEKPATHTPLPPSLPPSSSYTHFSSPAPTFALRYSTSCFLCYTYILPDADDSFSHRPHSLPKHMHAYPQNTMLPWPRRPTPPGPAAYSHLIPRLPCLFSLSIHLDSPLPAPHPRTFYSSSSLLPQRCSLCALACSRPWAQRSGLPSPPTQVSSPVSFLQGNPSPTL